MPKAFAGDGLNPRLPTWTVQKVLVVQGAHWNVPGQPMSIHATAKGADQAALGLVNVMLKDLDLPEAKTWKTGLRRVKSRLEKIDIDPDLGDVWITKSELVA